MRDIVYIGNIRARNRHINRVYWYEAVSYKVQFMNVFRMLGIAYMYFTHNYLHAQ